MECFCLFPLYFFFLLCHIIYHIFLVVECFYLFPLYFFLLIMSYNLSLISCFFSFLYLSLEFLLYPILKNSVLLSFSLSSKRHVSFHFLPLAACELTNSLTWSFCEFLYFLVYATGLSLRALKCIPYWPKVVHDKKNRKKEVHKTCFLLEKKKGQHFADIVYFFLIKWKL